MADAAGDQRGVAVHDCTETSTVAIRKVSVGTLTVAICETLDVRPEVRERHSLGVSRCESTPCLAWCCDRYPTHEALVAGEAGHVLHSLKHETINSRLTNYSPIQCVAASVSRNVNEMSQTVVTEHSLEANHLDIIAVIVMKVKNRQAVLDHCGNLLTVWKNSGNSWRNN